MTNQRNNILSVLTFVSIGVGMSLIGMLYLIHRDLQYNHELLKSSLVLQAYAPEPETTTTPSTWSIAKLAATAGVTWKVTLAFLKSKFVDYVKDQTIGYFEELPWKTNMVTLSMYLLVPGADFPDTGSRPYSELAKSRRHQLLFELWKLSRAEKIYSDNPKAIGYLEQFQEGSRIINKQDYLQKIIATTHRIYPEIEQAKLAGAAQKYWDKFREGDGDQKLAYILQTTYLSFVWELDQVQWDTCFDILFEKFIESSASDVEKDINPEQVNLLAVALSFLIDDRQIIPVFKKVMNNQNSEQEKSIKVRLKDAFEDLKKKQKTTKLIAD